MFCFQSPQYNVEKLGRAWLVFFWKRNLKRNTVLFSFVWQGCFFHFVAAATRPALWFSGNTVHATREELAQWFQFMQLSQHPGTDHLEENKQNEVSCLFSMFQHPSICFLLYSQSISHNFSYQPHSKIWLIFHIIDWVGSREVFMCNKAFSCPGSPALAHILFVIKENDTMKMYSL